MTSFSFWRRVLVGVSLGGALLASAGAEEGVEYLHGGWFAPGDSMDTRRYAPDRKVDILHQTLDVTPDFVKRTVSGSVTMTFKPIAKPVEELRLDGVNLSIHDVSASEKVQAWQNTGEEIVVTFAKPLAVDKEVKLTIKYSAEPKQGLYFRTAEMGYKAGDAHVWSQGESFEARHWFPCYDYPNEKFTTEMICHVPTGMVALSNGKLVEQKAESGGLTVFRWVQDKPHVNYLITLAAGYFKKLEDKHRDVPLEYYVTPSDLKEAPNSFRETREIMAFYEQEIGVPYPWAKYGQVVIQDFHWGGMENTSLTTLTDRTLFTEASENIRSSVGLNAHEMAHQWFGDLVTCKDWSHTWLNEGFATFYTHLFEESKYGRDRKLYGLWQTASSLVERTNSRAIVSRQYSEPEEMFRQFGYLAYGKGSWVLNMLRAQLGPDLYRRCIKTYLQRHQYNTVTTEDLRAVVEEVSGRSWDQFFDQWLYHGGNPELDINYSWDEKAKLAKISVKQTQRVSDAVLLFQFPLPVRFKGKSGVVDRTFQVTEREQDFYVSLKEAPQIVRIDPELTVLAKISFNASPAMLFAQLADKDDGFGRVLAANQLGRKKDKESVAKLKEALNNDAFYGARVEAAAALRSNHTDDARDALLASMKQSDARVRQAVQSELARFYAEPCYQAALNAARNEANPDIKAVAIRALGGYAKPEVREVLLEYLKSDSYRNQLAEAAIGAIRAQGDPAYLAPLRETLTKREAELTTPAMAAGLDAMAYAGKQLSDKGEVREFLLRYVNHPKQRIKLAAIDALGMLEDQRARPVLERFAAADKDSPEQKSAERALNTLDGVRKTPEQVQDLRKEVLDLQKQNRELGKQFEEFKKKLEAGDKTKPEDKK